MSLEELLSAARRNDDFKSKEEAKKALEEFLEHEEKQEPFKIGEFVTRNKFGQNRFKFPTGNNIAKVVDLYDVDQIDEHGNPVNMVIACTMGPTAGVVKFTVDRAYYEVSKPAKSNLFSLVSRKKKED